MSAVTEPDGSGEAREITVGETADGDPYTMPLEDLLTGRLFVTGKTGSGKSNTGSVIAEEILDRGLPLLIVDVDGEYWGLKEAYEILHVGATSECDLQVGPEHAGKLAELALEQHVPIILDVSGYLDVGEADALVRETARELFAREQDLLQPFLMLVEEIHEYIPEGGGLDDTGEMLIRIAKRGRKRGLGISGMSQRPANVKKDFITQADCLVWHRLTWSNDTAVVRDVVDTETADAVETLQDGEAFVQADWSDADVERVQFRRKETFDAGATPGLDDVDRPELKSIDEDLVDELEEISDRAEQRRDRIAELEQRLEEKDGRIQELEEDLEDARDLQRLGEAFVDAAQSSGETAVAEVDRELLEEKNETISELRDQVDDLEAAVAEVEAERDDYREEVERLRGIEDRIEQAERIEEQLEEARETLGVEVEMTAPADAAEADEELQRRLEAKDDRIEQLEERLERLQEAGGDRGVDPLQGYGEFLEDDDVRAVIEEAKAEATNCSPKHIKAIIATILDEQGPVSYDEVADRLGTSRTNEVSSAATTLESFGVIEKTNTSDGMLVDLNVEGLNEVREKAEARRRTDELMDEL